jgi:uncharacterized protein (TIGR02099 family)
MKVRRVRVWLITVVASLIVLAATLSGLFRVAVSIVPGYRQQLAGWVGRTLDHPARIGSMNLLWHGFQPVLDLSEVELLAVPNGRAVVHASHLRLGFSVRRLLIGDMAPQDITLSGLQVGLHIDEDGHLTLSGVSSKRTFDYTTALRGLGRFDAIHLEGCRFELTDDRLDDAPLGFDVTRVDVDHAGDTSKISATLRPPHAMAQGITLAAVLHGQPDQPAAWRIDWTAAVNNIAGGPWLTRLLVPGDRVDFAAAQLTAAGRWENGHAGETRLNLSADAITARHAGEAIAQLNQLQLAVIARPDGRNLKLSITPLHVGGVQGAWPPSNWQLQLQRPDEGDASVEFSADFLRADDLMPWLALWRNAPVSLDRLRDLRGDLRDLRFSLQPPDADDMDVPGSAVPQPLLALSARFQRLGLVSPSGEAPGFSGLGGTLQADRNSGWIKLDKSPMTLALPNVFEQPVMVDALSGTLAWHRDPDGLHLSMPQFAWKLAATAGNGHFDLLLPQVTDQSPQLDLQADLNSGDIVALKPLMPKTWGPHSRAWLDRAIQGGRVTQGHLELRGPLHDYPFVEHPTGRWQLDLDIADATLAYAPEWPAAQNLSAHLRMSGHGLEVRADGGSINATTIEEADAVIPDLRGGDLIIDGSTHGDAAHFYDALRSSPLRKRLAGLLNQTDATGPARLVLHLDMPLTGEKDQIHARGTVRLDSAQLKVAALDAPIRELSGAVAFGPAGVTADALKGRFHDLALDARIVPDAASPDGRLDVQFDASMDAADGAVAAYVPEWIRSRLDGTAHWNASMPFSGPGGGHLTLASDLRGATSRLPPPLRKSAEQKLPLSVQIGGDADVPLRLLIGLPGPHCDQLCVALRFANAAAGAAGKRGEHLAVRGIEARFGAGDAPQAAGDGIVITGRPEVLDAARWIGFLTGLSFGDASAPTLKRVDLSAAELAIGDFRAPATHLQLSQSASGWTLAADGEGAQGTIVWTAADGGHVRAQLDHLQLRPAPVSVPPPSAAVAVPSTPTPADKDKDKDHDIVDPTHSPTFDVDIAHLRMGDADLGRFGMTTTRMADGQSIDAFKLSGGLLSVDSRGSWRRGEGQSSAVSTFDIGSSDFGTVLKAFGYAPSLTGKKAHITGELSWPGNPAGLDFRTATGKVALEVENGTLTAVDPGASRVLGLFNLYALPRRLTLNFSDVMSKGLGFDRLHGNFVVDSGNATTDDLEIRAPSLRMQMRGRIGLAARDYDERVTVYPGISTEAALGVGLAGGPVGVAIALVAQQLFNKPLDRLTQFSYHVSGSWDNPQIRRGDSTPVTGPASAPPSPPAPAPQPATPDKDDEHG